ncbi:MAG: hypothetical protein ACE14V_02025 [bacterium]
MQNRHLYLNLILILVTIFLSIVSSTAAGNKISIYPVYPWSLLTDADTISEIPSLGNSVILEGFRNEFLVGAAIISADKKSDITITLTGDKYLDSSFNLRILGEVQGKTHDGKPVWYPDALFSNPTGMPDLTGIIRNWDTIRDFPVVHLSPKKPVAVWITVNTKDIKSEKATGYISLMKSGKTIAKLPISVIVHPIELPQDNPIIGYTWTTYKEDTELARTIRDYGINACGYYDNWKMLKQTGFRYFKFNFNLSNWNPESLKVSDAEIIENLQPIRDTIRQLNLKPEEWAIEIFDEPFDANAWIYAAWMIRIKRLWKEAQFSANPGYSWTNKNFATIENTINPLKDYVTCWCPYIDYLRQPEFIRALKQTRHPIWYYTIEYNHAKPSRGGRQLPWLAWRFQLDGWAFYSLKDSGNANPWNDNACIRMYPGRTMSIWMEGLRQGVGDYKRLWYLENHGYTYDALTAAIISTIPKKTDAPWGGADPELYQLMRNKLDELILLDMKKNK